MKKRSTRKSVAATVEFLDSPLPETPPSESPKSSFMFNNTTSLSKNKKKAIAPTTSTVRFNSTTNVVVTPQKTLTTISDLKDLASSRLDSVKRNSDRSHSDILKELEASQSRLHKRFKIQTQACQQLMDEADKEYRQISEQISENQEAMKASYAEFMAETQASASRVCKTAIPELSRSFKKAIDGLGSRFRIPST